VLTTSYRYSVNGIPVGCGQYAVKKNYDPKNKADRIARYRQVLDYIRQQKGDPTPTTDAEIDAYLQHAEDTVLREFFEKFFACVEIPDNQTRFDYPSMVQRAREAASA
jgi:hypothetical protein